MGVGGAMLGYSKDLTMLAILAVALVVEGINLLIRRSGPSDSENPDKEATVQRPCLAYSRARFASRSTAAGWIAGELTRRPKARGSRLL